MGVSESGDAPAVAETFAAWAAELDGGQIPAAVRTAMSNALLDFAGLCVSARNTDYLQAVIRSWEGEGGCTALGHARPLDSAGAALVNGTAAHGEDYDDTFEGTPVHTGAAVIPAVLAACEREGRSGAEALKGVAVGCELMCRMALVARTSIHRAGFHPTAVIGAIGAAAGVGAALGMPARQIADALGTAGSLASGIIEYLAEGTWTKRIHPGWAAQNGLRAVAMAAQGFLGPRTVFEGEHGFFHAFTDGSVTPEFHHLTGGLGSEWYAAKIAFKPYACGTMAQPFIDCAIALARDGVKAGDIAALECEVGEGTVHRLWEPLAEKWQPTTPYSAKFSVPFCIAVGVVDGSAGLVQFTEEKIRNPDILALAAKVNYRIDPENEYPRNYSGHIRATLADGTVREVRQPHLRGGAREPLLPAELADKFDANCAFGGWDTGQTAALRTFCESLFDGTVPVRLEAFRG